MRTLLLAVVALVVASVAMAQPVTRTDYPRMFTAAQLSRLRSEAGIEDDSQAWYQDKTALWATVVAAANAAATDMEPLMDSDLTNGCDEWDKTSNSGPYPTESQARSIREATFPVALVYAVTEGVTGQEALAASMLTKIRTQMDTFIAQAKVANACAGRDSLYCWTGETGADGGNIWTEGATYLGLLMLWDVTHDVMVGGTAADIDRHKQLGRLLFNQQSFLTVASFGFSDSSRKPWYSEGFRRSAMMAHILVMHDSPEVEAYPEYGVTENWDTRFTTFYAQWYDQQDARVQTGQGNYYSYVDDGSQASRSLEDIAAVAVHASAMTDSTDFRTTFSEHYAAYDDWLIHRVMSNIEQVGIAGDDFKNNIGLDNIVSAYPFASFEGDSATIGLIDNLFDATAQGDFGESFRFIYDDKQISRTPEQLPKGRLFGADNIVWGTEKANNTGRGRYAYFRTKHGYDSQEDDPTPRSDVAVFSMMAGPQVGSTHEGSSGWRGHYWLHRGDAWGTGRAGYYDALNSSFASYITHSMGHNTVRVIDPAHADYRSASTFDATEWSDQTSNTPVSRSWDATIGSQRWSPSSRVSGWQPYGQYGGWATYSYDRYKSGYFDKWSTDDDGFNLVANLTWDYPNTDLSSLWLDDVSIDSAHRKVLGWQLNGTSELLIIRGEAYNPARTGVSFVDNMWLPIDDIQVDGQTIGATAWDGGGTPLNAFSGTPGAQIGEGGTGYYYDVTDAAGEVSRFVFQILGGDIDPVLWVVGGPNSQGDWLKGSSWYDDGSSGALTNYSSSDPVRGTMRDTFTGGIVPPDPSFEFSAQGLQLTPGENPPAYDAVMVFDDTDSWGTRGKSGNYRLEARVTAADSTLHTWVIAHEVLDQGSSPVGANDALSGIDANHFGGAVNRADTVYVALFNRTMTANDDWSFSTTTTSLPVSVKIEGMTANAAVTVNLPGGGTQAETTDSRGFLQFTYSAGGTFYAGAVVVDDTAPTPEPLENFTIDGSTLSSLTLSWDAATDVSTPIEYIVEYQEIDGGGAWTSDGWGTDTTRVITGLGSSLNYAVRVQARDAAFNRQALWASTSGFTDDEGAPPDPTGLAAVAGSAAGEIDVSWDLPYDYDHQIEWQLDGGGYTSSGTRQETESTYTITGLVEGDTYDVRMRGLSSGGTVGNWVSTTGASKDETAPTPDPSTWATEPEAVSTTEVTMVATTATDPGGGIQYQFVETSGNPGATSSGWQASATYNDTGLTAGTQYIYYTQSRDTSGNTTTASTSLPVTTDPAPPPPSEPTDPGAYVFRASWYGEEPTAVGLNVYLGDSLVTSYDDMTPARKNLYRQAYTLDAIGHWAGEFEFAYADAETVLVSGGTFTQESYTPEEIDSTLVAAHGAGDWTAAELDAVLSNQLSQILLLWNINSLTTGAAATASQTQIDIGTVQDSVDAIITDHLYTESELYQYILAFQPGTWSSVNSAAEISAALADEFAAAQADLDSISYVSVVDSTRAISLASIDVIADSVAANVGTLVVGSGSISVTLQILDGGELTPTGVPGADCLLFTNASKTDAGLYQNKPLDANGEVVVAVDPGTQLWGTAKKSGYNTTAFTFTPTVNGQLFDSTVMDPVSYDPPASPDVCNVIIDIVELTGTASDSVWVCADFEGTSATWSGGAVSDNRVCEVTGRSFGGDIVSGRAVLPLIRSSAITEPNGVTTYEFNFKLNGREIYSDIEGFAVPDSTQCYLHLNLP